MDRGDAPPAPRIVLGLAWTVAAGTLGLLGIGRRVREPWLTGSQATVGVLIVATAVGVALLSLVWLRSSLPLEARLRGHVMSPATAVGGVLGVVVLLAGVAALPDASLVAGRDGTSSRCVAETNEVPLAPFEVRTMLQQEGLPMLSASSGQTTFEAPNGTIRILLDGPSDVGYRLEVDDGGWQDVPGNADSGYGVQDMGGMPLRLTVAGPSDGDGRTVTTQVSPSAFETVQDCA